MPWADPRVPEVVVRGQAVLPVVGVDRLPDLQARFGGSLIVAKWGSALVAFRVDEVTGIAVRLALAATSLPGQYRGERPGWRTSVATGL